MNFLLRQNGWSGCRRSKPMIEDDCPHREEYLHRSRNASILPGKRRFGSVRQLAFLAPVRYRILFSWRGNVSNLRNAKQNTESQLYQ